MGRVQIPEGRPGGKIDAADKIDSAQKNYLKSEKGRETAHKYNKSEKGKEAHQRHTKTAKFKLTVKKYYLSDKGQKAWQEIYQKRKEKEALFKEAQKWLKANPGKTLDDFLKTKEAEQDEKSK